MTIHTTKPPFWPINRLAVGLDWQWFFDPDYLQIFHPLMGNLWDQVGLNDGVETATPPDWISLAFGDVLNFNGTDEYYTVANAPEVATYSTADVTLLFYMRSSATLVDGHRYWHSLGPSAGTPSLNFNFSETGAEAGRAKMAWRSDGGTTRDALSDAAIFPSDDWMLIGFERVNNYGYIRVNGAQNTGADFSAAGAINSSADLHFGRRSNHSSIRAFNGEIAYWARINRALTDGEWDQLARYPLGPLQRRRIVRGGVVLTLDQEGFRWREDDGNETAATWLADQDVNITRGKDVNTRIRLLVNATGDPPSQQYEARYRKKGSGDPWRLIT